VWDWERQATVSDDRLNYQVLTEDALRSVVRKALDIVAEGGLTGQHHFYLTFRTDFPGVKIADVLRAKHPKEMTIVLQHQFWGLEVTDVGFSVTLSFNGQHERLVVPWPSLSAFVDPSVQFGLQFSVAEPAASAPVAALPTPPRPVAPNDGAPAGEPAADSGARVVTLDAFRKTDGRKK
jgi:uncharacterized protein